MVVVWSTRGDRRGCRVRDARRRVGRSVDDVAAVLEQYPAARGIRAARAVLPLVDAGADSPRETWLRLTDAGMPPDATQVPVVDERGRIVAILDMGWRCRVAVNYDGIFHQSDRKRYVRDLKTPRALEDRGWIVIRVIAEDDIADVIARVRRALLSRGWRRDSTGTARTSSPNSACGTGWRSPVMRSGPA